MGYHGWHCGVHWGGSECLPIFLQLVGTPDPWLPRGCLMVPSSLGLHISPAALSPISCSQPFLCQPLTACFRAGTAPCCWWGQGPQLPIGCG